MADRMAYAVDDTRWPLVIARATEFNADISALDASYAKLDAILARGRPFALMFDMRGAVSSPARRQRLHQWCQQREELLTRLLLVGAIVASSSIERGFITAGLWFRTPPWPMRVFSEHAEAELWLLQQFAALKNASAP